MTKIVGSGSGSTSKCHGSATLLSCQFCLSILSDFQHFSLKFFRSLSLCAFGDPDPVLTFYNENRFDFCSQVKPPGEKIVSLGKNEDL